VTGPASGSSTQGWLADPALTRIWGVLRARLEARGRRAEGRVVLTGLSRAERHAVSALVGRPVTKDRLTVDLATLDAWLAQRSGVGGVVAVVETATGRPVVDRQALRAQRSTEREAPVELLRALLPEAPWREPWLDGVRRSGLLSRTSDPEQAVRHAAAALARLPAPTSRTELATAVAGHAHALDEGTAAAALVLRALAARSGEPAPATTAQRRDLWERFGVRVDLVSTTCLTLGLRGTGSVAARLQLAAAAGDPVHLTPWDLRRSTLTPPASVLVCENPRVLEAVAERFGGRVPVVCTSGQPALVVLDVLHALRDAALRYHGDFDWPGVGIANRLVAEVGVTPWLMGADDYAAALGPAGLPLAGVPVEPSWDAELGAAMRQHSVAVHEEAVLGQLLAELGADLA
jgi:uncharacterized protein (TIGR02679 family)